MRSSYQTWAVLLGFKNYHFFVVAPLKGDYKRIQGKKWKLFPKSPVENFLLCIPAFS